MSERLEPRLANELLARLGAGFDVKLSYAEVPSRLPGGYSSDLFRLRLAHWRGQRSLFSLI